MLSQLDCRFVIFWIIKLNSKIWKVGNGGEQCDQKKSPNVYKKLPKNDFTRKMINFDTVTKLPKDVGDLDKIIVAKGFKNLPKVK